MSPHEALRAALMALSERNRQTPCQADAEPFVSDDCRARRRAAEQCQRCPVIELCRTAGLEHDHFVWGGIDRGRRDTSPAEEGTP